MTHPFRITTGGRINRANPITFTFDGKSLTGFEGDTIASALLANGIRLVGRSFKYHRPRGILSAGPEEPNALLELREGAACEPNTRATITELSSNLICRSQNRFPSLRLDLLSITGRLAPIFAAGFYYKTFMWPAAFWERLYEPLIRRAAGLGRASGKPDPDSYDKQTDFADILIIGAGQAGLNAALEASETGARVILAEQDTQIGGRLLSEPQPTSTWLAKTETALRDAPNVRILTRTTIVGVYDGTTYAAIERIADHLPTQSTLPRQRLHRIISPKCVLATGAIERPLVFGNNDTPGIMLAGAVRTYINRYAVKPGTRAVVFTNNDDAANIITDLAAAGIEIAGLIDTRPNLPDSISTLAKSLNVPVFPNATIRQAKGGQTLKSVILGGQATGTTLQCDLLAMSGGWNPAIHLASHHGGKPVWSDAIAAFTPGQMPPGMTAAGAAAGHFTPQAAAIQPLWQIPDSLGKSFVDFQNDVTESDLALAAREGFTAVEHLKRYTTLGMATDQGKTSNVTGLAILAALTNRTIPQTGTTVFRPPYTPVAIGALAGAHRGPHYRPTRRTSAHDWAEQNGAHFIEAGEWLRATHFPKPGESIGQATNREVRIVRTNAGFCDVSTLGKIDVQGPGAAVFLDFIYANTISNLAAGRVRYAIMLREDGFVFDDGTVARLSETHFLLTTTTANAARILRHMDFCHQILKPDFDICIEPVTDQWAQFALAGPRSRDILQTLVSTTNVVNSALPFMAATEATIANLPARLFRISFSGELAYEIAVPASHGAELATALLHAGASPYGLEALNVLRLEKGHPVGAELNGQTTAADLNLARMLSKKKDFIGRALAQRPALQHPNRPALVGLRPTTRGAPLQAGAHLIPRAAPAAAEHDQGHITSAAYSETLGHWIALGLLNNGRARHGEILRATNPLQDLETEVEVVAPIFHDPEGHALHV